MPVFDPSAHYRAYLLRCWAEASTDPNHSLSRRFSLQNPHTGERRGFASFELLLEFLLQELREASQGDISRED